METGANSLADFPGPDSPCEFIQDTIEGHCAFYVQVFLFGVLAHVAVRAPHDPPDAMIRKKAGVAGAVLKAYR
jgi:hypothetical protein